MLPSEGFSTMVHTPRGFVAGDASGSLWRSRNGLEWERHRSLPQQRIATLRYLNGIYFAFTTRAGGGYALTSGDGETWNTLNEGNGFGAGQTLVDAVWTGSRYVGVGYDWTTNRVLSATSPDSVSWVVRPTGAVLAFPLRLATDGARFVGIANGPLPGTVVSQTPPPRALALVSEDGLTWEVSAISIRSFRGDAVPRDIAFGNGTFVVVGGVGGNSIGDDASYIISSIDGTNWSAAAPAPDGITAGANFRLTSRLNAIGFARGKFFALGERQASPTTASSTSTWVGPLVASSGDGRNWSYENLVSTRPSLRLTALADYPQGLLANGAVGVLFAWTPGQGWTQLDTGLDSVGAGVYARGAFWFGSAGSVLRTVDGTVWSRYPLETSGLRDPGIERSVFRGLVFTGEAFIGILQSATTGTTVCFRSTDGVTWTRANLGSNYLHDISYGHGVVVAVGDIGEIVVSRDHGLTWSPASSGTREVQLRRIAYGEGKFVALSDRTAHTSDDGITWKQTPLPSGSFASAMVYFRGQFLRAGGVIGSGDARVLRSNVGSDWTSHPFNVRGVDRVDSVSSFVEGPDGLYCSARLYQGTATSKWILFSPDGSTWELLQKVDLAPLAYGGETFLGVGEGVFSAALTPPSKLQNLSSLAGVEAQPLTAGFTISGGAAKTVLLRSSGRALTAFGVTDPLTAVVAHLYGGSGQVVDVTSSEMLPLGTTETLADVTARLGAFPQTPDDRSMFLRLSAGSYTLEIAGVDGATGNVLAEIYDADTGSEPTPASLTNLSTRTVLGAGAATSMAGVVITGTRPKTVLVRGIGPSLRNFGVARAAADPELAVFDATGTTLAANDNWGSNDQAAAVRLFGVQRGAFSLDEGSRDAAVLLTLAPGAYTAHVRDRAAAGGDVLIEVYEVP